MGLTSFNRMRRAQAAARLAEQERLAAEKLAVQEAERLAREEEERLREEEEERKAAEAAARLEAERLAGEQGELEDSDQTQQDLFAPEFEGTQPSSDQEEVAEITEHVPSQEPSFNKLRAMAKQLHIEGYGKMTKDQLVEAIAQTSVEE